MIAALLLAVAMPCYPSTVPDYPVLCVETKKLIVTPVPSPTPKPTSTPTIAPTATPAPPTPSPSPDPTATPSPVPTATPQSNIVWQAGDPVKGKWERSNSGQCDTPILVGDSFSFPLSIDGTNCYRNMMNPLADDGSLFLLTNGATYTWSWRGVDGPAPGMGPDVDARSLVWQIHGLNEQDSPCTGLDFINGPNQVSTPQMWGFTTCAGLVWSGAYTPGESDDWKVVARVSYLSDGWTELYRNGQLQGHWAGANFHNSASNQAWFNFGAYKWRWELANGGGSTMTSVNQTISNMTVTSP